MRYLAAQQGPHRFEPRARLQRRVEVAALRGDQQLDADHRAAIVGHVHQPARGLFSETSAAAVTCGIMKPELSPGRGVRNAGRPDKAGSTSMAMRRSLS